MQKLTYLTLYALCFFLLCSCVAPNTRVSSISIDKTYGDSGKEGLRTIATLSDGGFILAGWRDQQKPGHVGIGYLINIAADGSVRWTKDIVTNGENRVSTVIQKSDGHLVIVLEEYPTTEDAGNVVLMELSAQGKVLRQREFGRPGPDLVEVLRATPDGGYMFAGESAKHIDGDYQAWVGSLSADFELQWQQYIGEPDSPDVFQDLSMLSDGSIIAVGMLTEHSTDIQKPARPLAAKFSPDGELIWSKIIKSGDLFALRGIAVTRKGDVALAGYTRKWDSKTYNAWLGVMSPGGELIWQHESSQIGFDQLYTVEAGFHDDFFAIGATQSEQSDYDALIVRFTDDGQNITIYQHQKPGRQFGRAIRPLADGSFAVGGFDTQDDVLGQQLWFLRHKISEP